MRNRPALVILMIVILAVLPASTPPSIAGSRGFQAETSRISSRLEDRMTGRSWHRGCPVPIRRLRLIQASYHGFDGHRQVGRLVAHKNEVSALVRVLRSMYRNGFRIRRMWLVDRYEGSDRRSMRADNTSAFNCRRVAGTDTWSEHAYGKAIDINPVENPYVASDGSVRPRKGSAYVDRSQHRKGMIHGDDATVRAFERAGWEWGGYWTYSKDYQHFSASGR